ncbi:hypothetical protein FIM12_06330 [SAR202 cluster bacterium AD-804-J14_MRT_500m]|nr:hypothetical protein [SAR202 cluster bacterium AD-804-J14_MRT_500m]
MVNRALTDDRVQISIDGEELRSSQLTADVSAGFYRVGSNFKIITLILAGLFIMGLVPFIIRCLSGFDDDQRSEWGYIGSLFGFLMLTAGSAPLVAVAFRMTRNHWRRPFSRISELYAIVGMFTLSLMLPLMAILPTLEGRHSLWVLPDVFRGDFVWYDFAAVAGLVICGISLLFLSALPDMALLSRHDEGRRARVLAKITRKWNGSRKQWEWHQRGIWAFGTFYFMLLIFVQTIIAVDFVMSLVPGWIDSIMPAHQALTGLQCALGSVIVGAFIVRTFGPYKKYIPMESFWSISKVLLALSLLWAYFWFAALITFWYGRTPDEQNILKTFMFESYRIPFLINFFCSFLIPFGMLIWNPVRKSVIGPTIAGVSVLIGAYFMTVRLYVPAFGLENVTGHSLDLVPLPITPNIFDILIIIGGLSGAALIFMLASKIIPIISIWEMKEGLLYQRARPFLRSRYMVLGKPE